jgi:hypothetical protein
MAKKQAFTFENNFDKVQATIQGAPSKVLTIIGANIVREVKPTLPKYYKRRSGLLTKSLGYWHRKQENDLQIGFKKFYAPFVMKQENEPLLPVIQKNKDMITKLIKDAIEGKV